MKQPSSDPAYLAWRKTTPSGLIRFLFGLGLSGLTLYLIFRQVELGELGRAIRKADAGLLVLAGVVMTGNILSKAARWKLLFGPAGDALSFRRLSSLVVAGQALNWLMPVRLGELLRLSGFSVQGLSMPFVLGTLFIEKGLDLGAYILIFGLLLLLAPVPTWISIPAVSLILLVGGSLGALAVLGSMPGWLRAALAHLPPAWQTWLEKALVAMASSLKEACREGGLAWAAVWSLFTWLLAVWTNQLVAQALELELPLAAALLLVVALQAGVSIPAGPGRVGIFEAICLLALSVFGVRQAQALSFGILLHAVVLLPLLAIGLVLLLMNWIRPVE